MHPEWLKLHFWPLVVQRGFNLFQTEDNIYKPAQIDRLIYAFVTQYIRYLSRCHDTFSRHSWNLLSALSFCLQPFAAKMANNIDPNQTALIEQFDQDTYLMGESSKFPKSWTLEKQIFKLAGCLQKSISSHLNGELCLDNMKINQRSYNNLPNSAFWGWLSMESQPQNPEFRINPENFHPWYCLLPW